MLALRLCGTQLGTQGGRPALRPARDKAQRRWPIERSGNLVPEVLGEGVEAHDTRLHLRK